MSFRTFSYIDTLPPSIEDVARHAGVSTATVSRVLNRVPKVREPTRARVEASISALGYRVSETARSLAMSSSRQILALVPDFGNAYYGQIVRGIESVARERGYHVLLADTHGDLARERTYVDMLRQQRADGVICLDPVTVQRLYDDEVRAFPWVACSEVVPESAVSSVSIDHREAARDAVLYLLSRGHRKIALVNSDERYFYAQQRRAGYLEAMREAGAEVPKEYVQCVGGVDYPLGELAARRLLTLDAPPTAIFAVADTLAIGVIKAAFRTGRKVPDDLAVIGFDDLPIAEMFEPSLTTISQPMVELGQRATALLFDRMENSADQREVLQHRLVIRESA